MRRLIALCLTILGLCEVRAQSEERIPIKTSVYSTKVPGGAEWRQIGSAYLSATYQNKDLVRSRHWLVRVAGVQISPAKTRDELLREFRSMSTSMLKVPGFEQTQMQVLPANVRKYECVEGLAVGTLVTEVSASMRVRVALCRHPVYATGAVLIAMSVGFKDGDEPSLAEFDRVVDDLVMY